MPSVQSAEVPNQVSNDSVPKFPARQSLPLAMVPSPGTGWAMVRGLALMVMAAMLSALVWGVQHLLLDRMALGGWMDAVVLWSVLLAALMLLSGPSVTLAYGLLAQLDSVARKLARRRSAEKVI